MNAPIPNLPCGFNSTSSLLTLIKNEVITLIIFKICPNDVFLQVWWKFTNQLPCTQEIIHKFDTICPDLTLKEIKIKIKYRCMPSECKFVPTLTQLQTIERILGPVVQSIVSLTSLLVIKILTVLVSTISNSQVFLQKLLTYFQQKY